MSSSRKFVAIVINWAPLCSDKENNTKWGAMEVSPLCYLSRGTVNSVLFAIIPLNTHPLSCWADKEEEDGRQEQSSSCLCCDDEDYDFKNWVTPPKAKCIRCRVCVLPLLLLSISGFRYRVWGSFFASSSNCTLQGGFFGNSQNKGTSFWFCTI